MAAIRHQRLSKIMSSNMIAKSLLVWWCCLFAACQARYASINVNVAMTVSDESHKLSEDMVRICCQQTDLSMEELAKFRQNDFRNSTEATQCFTHCMYEQMGLIRDGIFVERDFLRTLADVTDPNMLLHKRCHELKADNKCERAFLIHQCLAEQGANVIAPNNPTQGPAVEPDLD